MKSSKSNAKAVNKQENKVARKGNFAAAKTGNEELKGKKAIGKMAKLKGMKIQVVK